MGGVRFGFVVEFYAVGFGAADDVFLFFGTEVVPVVRAVVPQLVEEYGGSGAGLAVGDCDDSGGFECARVFGAVFEAGEVAVEFVDPAGGFAAEFPIVGELFGDVLGDVEGLAAGCGCDPDPGVFLGGGHLVAVFASDGGVEVVYAFGDVVGVGDLCPEAGAYADDDVCADCGGKVDGISECCDGCACSFSTVVDQVQFDEGMVGGAECCDAGLVGVNLECVGVVGAHGFHFYCSWVWFVHWVYLIVS